MTQTKKYSILVVDDDSANIRTLTHILYHDYTIYAAKSGQTALEVAKKNIPDLILLDVIMPYMNGYEVLDELKKSDNTKNIPVIFITGLNDSSDEEKGFDLGVDDYIPKPFSENLVKLRVRSQIRLIEKNRKYEYEIQKYKLVNTAMQIALWDKDFTEEVDLNPQSLFNYSQEFHKMLGFSDENDPPNQFSTLTEKLHPEDKEYTINLLISHLNDFTGNTTFNPKFRLMCKNGEYRYFQAHGTTMRDLDGKPIRFAGSILDITDIIS